MRRRCPGTRFARAVAICDPHIEVQLAARRTVVEPRVFTRKHDRAQLLTDAWLNKPLKGSGLSANRARRPGGLQLASQHTRESA